MKRTNPAKLFLMRYRAISGRIDALQRAIDDAIARAQNISVSLKEIVVISSPAIHDPIAENVATAADAAQFLYEERDKAKDALREILSAINSLSDERQKQLLTLRYINGEGFEKIQEAMHYEKTQVFVIHGRALLEVNKWLQRKAADDKQDEGERIAREIISKCL